jgi:Rps23 Pro-64 3,4-dihydroxylase Tpa1-like proline 4-hydroxylase
MSSSVISVVTKPAVLIQPQQTQVGDLVTHNNRTPAKHVCIEDFLTPAENKQLLDYTLENEPHFEGSTVLTKAKREEAKSIRQSRVLFKIAESKWRDVFISRLKLHLPHVAATIGLDFQEFESNEIQLTASNDGDFFKQHADADHNDETVANRVVTFVYYLHQMPKPYSGGDLLLYGDPGMSAIDTGSHVTSITPVNNMLVAFPSDLLHEVDIVECPSHAFSDSRFTINGWLRSGAA